MPKQGANSKEKRTKKRKKNSKNIYINNLEKMK
jgi:hypothetical protein